MIGTIMTIQTVVKMGTPSLWQASEPVTEFNTSELRDLVQDLFDTMQQEKGVGIAAPQIGVNKQIFVFGFETNPRYPHAGPVPRTVLINPEFMALSDELEDGWEGCLSVPGLRGLVPRYKYIRYSGYDIEGNKIEREANSFHARIIQHETDHLNGVLYPQRIKDFHNFGFETEITPAIQAFYAK
jgi:peptide deformylase